MAIASHSALVKPWIELLDDGRLVGHLTDLDSDRKTLFQLLGDRAQILAELQHVGAGAHGDADADRLAVADAEYLLRRIHIRAFDGGDAQQLHEAIVDVQVDVAQALLGEQRAADLDEDAFRPGIDHARGLQRVLGGDCAQHLVQGDAELGQPLRREVEVDLLFLVAVDLYLAHVVDPHEGRTRRLGEVTGLAKAESVECDAVDDAEDVAELVVEGRPLDILRQSGLDVRHFLADLIPDLRDDFGVGRIRAG